MADTEQDANGDVETTSIGEVEVEEDDCGDATAQVIEGDAEPVDEETTLAPEEEAELDELLASESAEEAPPAEADAGTVRGLGRPGGGWGGSENPAKRAARIGSRNGLTITSTKRNWGSSGSDHNRAQRLSYAVDMSNGGQPTPQMDRTARQIAKALGFPGWRGSNLVTTVNGYRVQLLYRTKIGGNHFNHVHCGVRML